MNEATLLPFLLELRKRLLHCVLFLGLIFFVLFYFANQLYTYLAYPLLKYLPPGHNLIATNIVSPFFVPCDLTFHVTLFIGVPFILYQIWAFVAPALYPAEKKVIWPLLWGSTVLFYTGMMFAYWIIFPLLFRFFTRIAPLGVTVSPDISQYLDFTLHLLLIFGIIFEVPIVTVILVWSGITTRKTLIRIRPYVIVGAFIVGMLIAPPDVLSQIMLAVPLWFLYEAGVFCARFVKPRDARPITKG